MSGLNPADIVSRRAAHFAHGIPAAMLGVDTQTFRSDLEGVFNGVEPYGRVVRKEILNGGAFRGRKA